MAIQPITFDYRETNEHACGFNAAEVDLVVPEAVTAVVDEEEDENGEGIPVSTTLNMYPMPMLGVLWQAVRELEARVKELEDKS